MWPHRLAGLVVPLSLACCATISPPVPVACTMVPAARVPFLFLPGDNRVELPADVDGHPAHLLLDTGSNITALTDLSFHRLSAQERPEHTVLLEGVGGSQLAPATELWRLRLGRIVDPPVPGVVSDELTVVVLDHSILPPIPPTDGLLGLDAFAGYDVDFDFAGGALGLYRAEGDCHRPHSLLPDPTGTVGLLPEIDQQARPRFAVTVEGMPMVAEIDTGAPTTILLASAAHRLGLAATAEGRLVGGIGGGHVLARNIRLASIQLGSAILHDMPATVLAQDLMEPVDLLLGTDVTRLLHIWYSRSSRTLILQYPPLATPGLH